MYADDTLLYFASSSVNSIESNLSVDLANVIQWLNSSYLHPKLQQNKSNAYRYTPKAKIGH